jgi:N-acetylneuraminate synthase
MNKPLRTAKISGREIGRAQPPYVVSEMSGNHNGDIQRAFRILDASKAAGVDAVKIQTYRADTITIDHSAPEFIVTGGLWHGRRLFELYEEAHTPWEWHKPIFSYARDIGVTLFSSPFDRTAVDLLESLNAPAYKIASPELVDLPLIRYVSQTGKPVILSTGMATSEEIGEAVETARSAGVEDLIVLHCTSAYPAPPEEANLATIQEIANRFDVVAGLSDHTMGTSIAALAVVMGADLIEKHVTLSRAEGGVDSAFSLEPHELAELVAGVRTARLAIGSPAFEPTISEASVLRNRRSLYVVEPMVKGDYFSEANLRSIRPGNGMKPKHYEQVLGRRASVNLKFGQPLDPSLIEGGFPE